MTTVNNHQTYTTQTFMPGTNTPAPELMTAEEAIVYLRLDTGRDVRDAKAALERLVKTKGLRPTRIVKHNLFARRELDRFIIASTRGACDASEDAPPLQTSAGRPGIDLEG